MSVPPSRLPNDVAYCLNGRRDRETIAAAGLAHQLPLLEAQRRELLAAGWTLRIEARPRGEPPIVLNAERDLMEQAV